MNKFLGVFVVLALLSNLTVSLYCFVHGNNLGGIGAGFCAISFGFVAALGAAMGPSVHAQTIHKMKEEAYQEGYNAGLRVAHKVQPEPPGCTLREDRQI